MKQSKSCVAITTTASQCMAHISGTSRTFSTAWTRATAAGCATHLDLVQEPTDPVWSDLNPRKHSALLERDLPFLLWQLTHLPHLKAVFCAGRTVSDQLHSHALVQVTNAGTTKLIKWWYGSIQLGERDLPIGGWNRPLDKPTGLDIVGERELGRMFANVPL